MKIAIISDTHDNLKRLEKVLLYLKKNKLKYLLHCGDVCSEETLKYLSENFDGKIYLTLGNAELFDLDDINQAIKDKIEFFDHYSEIRIADKIFGMVHKKEHISNADIKNKKITAIFYGHTHKPWIEKVDNKYLVNSGNVAGLYYDATFCVYDTSKNKFELKLIDKI